MVQDYVHILIQIPPNHAAYEIVGYIKGKSEAHARLVLKACCTFDGGYVCVDLRGEV